MHSDIVFAQSAVIGIISFLVVASGSPVERSSEIVYNNVPPVQLVHNGTVVELNLTSNEREALIEALIKLRQRQDEGGLENVAEIISGVLSGSLGNIFTGSSNFVGNSAVQEEITFVFNNVSPVVDTLIKFSWDGLKQYFGIGVTTPEPMVAVTQQPQLVNQTSQNNVQIPVAQSQPVVATVPVETTPISEDADNDNDNDANVM